MYDRAMRACRIKDVTGMQIGKQFTTSQKMSDRFKIVFFFVLVFSGIGLRLLCRDIPNFAPVAALSLFSGFLFSGLWVAVLVPFSVLVISNLCFGGYDSWGVMLSVYGCLILPVFFGRQLLRSENSQRPAVSKVFGLTLLGSLLFFFVTNYASWTYWYPQTVNGLIECYVAAIPFFRYTLMGDVFFAVVFFGAHALVLHLSAASDRNRLIANSSVLS